MNTKCRNSSTNKGRKNEKKNQYYNSVSNRYLSFISNMQLKWNYKTCEDIVRKFIF